MTLRSDVFGSMRSEPIISRRVGHLIASVWPTVPDDLEIAQMIQEPADFAGIDVEPLLRRRIVSDASKRGGDALPFVAQCLHVLCKKARDKKLTLEAYEALGGLSGVVDHEAHEFEEQVADDAVIKRLFELITVSTPATFERRSATRDELISKGISDQLLSVAIDSACWRKCPTIKAQRFNCRTISYSTLGPP